MSGFEGLTKKAKQNEIAIKTLEPLVLQEHYDSMTEQQRNAMALAIQYALKGLFEAFQKQLQDLPIIYQCSACGTTWFTKEVASQHIKKIHPMGVLVELVERKKVLGEKKESDER